MEAGSAINRAIGPSTISFLNPNQMASGNAATTGDVPTADGAGRITWEAQSGGGGGGTVTTSAPVSGDGSAGDPVTIANQAIDHTKIGSTVAGVDQAAGRILEADGAGDVRWADQSGGGGGGGGAEVDAVDVTYTQASRVLSVSVQQDNNADFVDSVTLPTPSENHAGLLELATTGEVDQGIIRGALPSTP